MWAALYYGSHLHSVTCVSLPFAVAIMLGALLISISSGRSTITSLLLGVWLPKLWLSPDSS